MALLTESIDAYRASRVSQGVAKNTLRNNDRDLRRLLTVVGNIQMRDLGGRHMDAVFADAALTQGPASLNNLLASLSGFLQWCRMRGLMPRDSDPLGGRRPRKVPPRDRTRVHVSKFPALLDAAQHPRDRAVIALGLYLFLRGGEVASLRVRDLDLAAGEIRVVIHKTADRDVMPVSAELDAEMRRWLVAYQDQAGPLDPDWFLVPSKQPGWGRAANGQLVRDVSLDRVRPTRPVRKIEDVAKRSLAGIGHPLRDTKGASMWEGMHTLRRSGARALFDEMTARGYDGALQQVKTWLHHADASMTERYLGLNVERAVRNDAVRGKPMFPSLTAPEVESLAIAR
jgi:integrase